MAIDAINNQMTIQQIIDSTSKNKSERNTGELGKDDFLNLLVTQLRYQDPLKPVDDKEFIGQMAQFSALEQMQNMNTVFSSVKAFSLIGKHITANIKDDVSHEIRVVEGEVTNVKMSLGKTFVVVQGVEVPVDQVTNVSDTLASSYTNISSYTGLIGYNVSGAVYNSQTGDIVNVRGSVKEIVKGRYEDYAVIDGVQVEISDIVTDNPSSDPNFKQDYFEKHISPDDPDKNVVTVYIKDAATGKKVAVKATLKDYSIIDDKITATLDGVHIPVDSIISVKSENNDVTL